MPKKPSELINGGGAVLPQTSTQPTQPASSSGGSGWLVLVVMLLAGWLIFSVVNRINWDGDHKQDGHHEQKDDDHEKQDDKKQNGKLAAKPGYLLIVRERIAGVDDDEAAQRVAEFASKAQFADASDKLEYRDVDKDDDSEPVRKFIEHAKGKGVSPPFVLFKSKDNALGNVIKLPAKSDPDSALLEVFK